MVSSKLKILIVTLLIIGTGSVATSAHADNILDYHWARTTNPFTVSFGDNVTGNWDSYLLLATKDWSLSSVLDTVVMQGKTNPKNCLPTSGKVEVCNSKYGPTGWLGVASVWSNGAQHITQATVKMNDTYFATAKYNTPQWKRLVMCQEIGHALGLDHQDEDFSNANLGTCMDYTDIPASNISPNAYDYETLESIYAHLDLFPTIVSMPAKIKGNEIDHNDKTTWGKPVRKSKDGKETLFVKDVQDGQILTYVIWSEVEAEN